MLEDKFYKGFSPFPFLKKLKQFPDRAVYGYIRIIYSAFL